MTAHPIDTEAFLWLDRLDDAVKHRAYDCTCQVGGVDAMSIDTDWLRHALAEIRRAHRNMAERAGTAEHRATRAEARVKAVEDVLDDGTWTGLSSGKDWVSATAIRRALEG